MIPPTYGTRDADIPVDPGTEAGPGIGKPIRGRPGKTPPIGKRVVIPPERLARAEEAERAVGVIFVLGLILGFGVGAAAFMLFDLYWPN